MECTGTYGAGLLRYLHAQDIEVLEATGPDQALRRRKGKDDTLDVDKCRSRSLCPACSCRDPENP